MTLQTVRNKALVRLRFESALHTAHAPGIPGQVRDQPRQCGTRSDPCPCRLAGRSEEPPRKEFGAPGPARC